MFTFIKKVIKTGTATSSYPLEPIAVDKNFRGKPEQNPQQCIGCAACVNACPSNALTVETDLATGELAWEFLWTLRRSLPDGSDQTVARVRTGGVEERRFPATVPFCAVQLSRLQSSFRRPERDRLRHCAA